MTKKGLRGWSKFAELATFDTGNRPTMQAQFDEPGDFTVQFALEPALLPLLSPIECIAIIEWKVAGNTVRRRVTVGNGMSVTGTAEAVHVTFFDASTTGIAGVKYTVTVNVAPGVRPTVQQPALLIPPIVLAAAPNNPIVLAPAGTHDYPVPQDSGAISVYVSVGSFAPILPGPIPDQSVTVRHLAPGGFILKNYDPRNFIWVPLSPGTERIQVANLSLIAALRFQVHFGIDG